MSIVLLGLFSFQFVLIVLLIYVCCLLRRLREFMVDLAVMMTDGSKLIHPAYDWEVDYRLHSQQSHVEERQRGAQRKGNQIPVIPEPHVS